MYQKYISNVENNISKDPRKFWAYANNKRRNSDISYKFQLDDKNYDNDQSIADGFAEYFKSVYSTKTDNIAYSPSCDYNLDTFSIRNISNLEVEEAIRCLKPKTSAGIDGLPGYFFKAYMHILSEPLARLYNLSLQSNTFPDRQIEYKRH